MEATIPPTPRSSKDHAKKYFKSLIDSKYVQTVCVENIRNAYLYGVYNCFLASTVTAFKIGIESSSLQSNHRFENLLPAKISTQQQNSNIFRSSIFTRGIAI
jgi:hypothetical protein